MTKETKKNLLLDRVRSIARGLVDSHGNFDQHITRMVVEEIVADPEDEKLYQDVRNFFPYINQSIGTVVKNAIGAEAIVQVENDVSGSPLPSYSLLQKKT